MDAELQAVTKVMEEKVPGIGRVTKSTTGPVGQGTLLWGRQISLRSEGRVGV